MMTKHAQQMHGIEVIWIYDQDRAVGGLGRSQIPGLVQGDRPL
jgi:hypothetical protein